MKKDDLDNSISYDISLDEDLSGEFEIGVQIEPPSSESIELDIDCKPDRSDMHPLDRLINGSAKVHRNIKQHLRERNKKRFDDLAADNPGYSFLLYSQKYERKLVKRRITTFGFTSIYSPEFTYEFSSPEGLLLYSAQIKELERQDIKIRCPGIRRAEIIENRQALKRSTFSIIIDGIYQGELVRIARDKNITIFAFNDWEIREKFTGLFEICTHDNQLIASLSSSPTHLIIQYWSEDDETLIVTLITALNAYHNSRARQLNGGKPYYVVREHLHGG